MMEALLHITQRFTLNPHIHAITSRGVFTPDGEWIPVPYVDEHRAELLFATR